MTPTVDLSGIKKCRAWEYALRFLFGGVVSVLASLVAKRWGPAVGGLFLAFPAILPASLTLAKSHDGRAQAVDDARGARIGAVCLCLFAVLVCLLSAKRPALVLILATVTWAVTTFIFWWVVYGRQGSRASANAGKDR